MGCTCARAHAHTRAHRVCALVPNVVCSNTRQPHHFLGCHARLGQAQHKCAPPPPRPTHDLVCEAPRGRLLQAHLAPLRHEEGLQRHAGAQLAGGDAVLRRRRSPLACARRRARRRWPQTWGTRRLQTVSRATHGWGRGGGWRVLRNGSWMAVSGVRQRRPAAWEQTAVGRVAQCRAPRRARHPGAQRPGARRPTVRHPAARRKNGARASSLPRATLSKRDDAGVVLAACAIPPCSTCSPICGAVTPSSISSCSPSA